MKIKLLAILLMPVVAAFAYAATASAQTFRSGETASVAATEKLDGSAFVAGSTVTMAGSVNGDLYCAGQTVTISGDIDGDVLCAAQTIILSGTVTGDVRLVGQTITISGDVKGSASTTGQVITLESTGKVGRDALLLGQTANVGGNIGRDVTLGSATAHIDAVIGRNVSADVESLTLGGGANVSGSLDYRSPSMLTKDGSAVVQGKTTYTKQTAEQREYRSGGFNLAGAILSWLMLVVSAFVFALLFPRELHSTTNASALSAPQTLLAIACGLVAGIVMPIAIILLMVTVFALPFAVVLLVAWTLIVLLSGAFASYYVGRLILRSQSNALLIMLVGAAVVATVLAIPIINILAGMVLVWYGTGALLLRLKQLAVAPRYDMVPKVRAKAK